MIKQSGHLRTLEKRRKHLPAAHVFYISLEFSNTRRVLSQSNTKLRLVYLLNKGMAAGKTKRVANGVTGQSYRLITLLPQCS